MNIKLLMLFFTFFGCKKESTFLKKDYSKQNIEANNFCKSNKLNIDYYILIDMKIHSGKNRIVRRMFEQLGYEVVKLDRVQFASLTKKDLPRGYYRHLTEKEIAFLKMTK